MPKCVDEDDIGAVPCWSGMLFNEGTRVLLADSFGEAGGEAPDSVEGSDGRVVGAAKSLASTELPDMPDGGVAISKIVKILGAR
jgi:hypothetical protein